MRRFKRLPLSLERLNKPFANCFTFPPARPVGIVWSPALVGKTTGATADFFSCVGYWLGVSACAAMTYAIVFLAFCL